MDNANPFSFVKETSPAGAAFDLDSFKGILKELQESKHKQKKGFFTGLLAEKVTE
jgi:hypothetical protein